jgi:hypothetical protein
MSETKESKPQSLREVMPQTAAVIDELRREFAALLGSEEAGRRYVNGLVAKGARGEGGFYFAEVGPDGVAREYGSTVSGERAAWHPGQQRFIRVKAPQ